MSIYFVDNFGVISFNRASNIVNRYVDIQARIYSTISSLERFVGDELPTYHKRVHHLGSKFMIYETLERLGILLQSINSTI